MTALLTTYLAEGREVGIKFLFKYHLNGFIAAFEVVGQAMNEKQVDWLFKLPEGALYPRFPAKEADFKERWVNDKAMQEKFTVTEQPPDLSFDALWQLYGYKMSRQDAAKAFKKLSQADVIKCFTGIIKYNEWLNRHPKTEKLYLATFINKRRWEDELPEPEPPKMKVGKVFNPALQDLAKRKTGK